MITFAVAMSLPATTISLADRLFLSPPNGVGRPWDLAWIVGTETEDTRGAIGTFERYADYRDLHSQLPDAKYAAIATDRVVARVEYGGFVLSQFGELISSDFFGVLDVGSPFLGTYPTTDVFERSERAVILSYDLWRRLGADGSIVGRALRLSGQSFVVYAVAPAGFRGLEVLNPSILLGPR